MSDKKGSWIVQVVATVTKQVACKNCTREQARENPFDYAEDETEIDQQDYRVIDVKEDK